MQAATFPMILIPVELLEPHMTTSNKLYLLRPAFFWPSASPFFRPEFSDQSEQSKAPTPPGRTNKDRAHGNEAPYWEPRRSFGSVMAGNTRRSVGDETCTQSR